LVKYELGDKSAVMPDYNRAIEIDPSSANAYYNRGLLKYELGNSAEAIVDMDKAAQLFQKQGQMDKYRKAVGLTKKFKG
jgi:tetratricopeptide (TPR) repeat protein